MKIHEGLDKQELRDLLSSKFKEKPIEESEIPRSKNEFDRELIRRMDQINYHVNMISRIEADRLVSEILDLYNWDYWDVGDNYFIGTRLEYKNFIDNHEKL